MVRITPEMVGRALGVPAQAIRVGLQQNKLPFGTAYKQTEGGKRYTYVFYPEAVKQTIGAQAFNEMIKAAREAV